MKYFFTYPDKKWLRVFAMSFFLSLLSPIAGASGCYNTTNGYGPFMGAVAGCVECTNLTPTCSSQTAHMASTAYQWWSATAGVQYNFSLASGGTTWSAGYDMTIYYYDGSNWVPGANSTSGSISFTPTSGQLTYTTELLVDVYNGTGCSTSNAPQPAWPGTCCGGNSALLTYQIAPANGGTLTQTPGSGGHQCTGSNVAYSLSGYLGSISNWNYDWTTSSNGATLGWTNWSNGGSATQNWTCGQYLTYDELQVNVSLNNGGCTATSNTVNVIVDNASNAGSFVTNPIYSCGSGTLYAAGGTSALTGESITGFTGSISGWGWGTNTTTCTGSGNAIQGYAGQNPMNLNCCWPGVGSGSTDVIEVQVTNGVCASAYNCISVTTNAMTAPTAASVSPTATCAPASGNITLSCSGGGASGLGVLKWYSGTCGTGTLVGTGTSLTIAAPSSTTTYYPSYVDPCGGFTACGVSATYTVTPIPTITGTTPGSHCGTGTVGLSATSSAGTITWWSAATGGTNLGTGTSFTTPSLTTTTTYYIDASLNGCTTASRTAVVATIFTVPTITSSGGAATCNSGTLNLTATASAGTINWWAAASGGSSLGTGSPFTTPNISTTTTYYVDATANGCPSASRTAVVATINPNPTVFGVTGGGPYCLGSSGSAVGLAGSQTGVNYQLVLNGSTNIGSPVAGNGSAINFGSFLSGPYTVVATATTGSCVLSMSGSVTCTVLSPVVTNTPASGIGTNGGTMNGTD